MNTRIVMPPTSVETPDLADLRQEVRGFLRDSQNSRLWTAGIDGWHIGWNLPFSKALADRGWVGTTTPKKYGGHGKSHIERFVITEELVAAGAPVAAHWIADRQMAPSVLRFGSEEQKIRLLPQIAHAELTFAIGMSEPEAGSDLASVRTRATKAAGGWLINGSKLWTSGAHLADAVLVLARTSPADPEHRRAGLTQFVIYLDSEGIDTRPIRWMSGASHFNEIFFENVFVPDSLVLGAVGDGWKQVTSELNFERSGPERFLSTFPLLKALVESNGTLTTSGAREIGRLLARVAGIHTMSMAVSGALTRHEDVGASAAVVKVIGSLTEGDIAELADGLLGNERFEADNHQLASTLINSLMQRSGFTLRGGTTEILHGVISRELGMR